MDVVVGAFHRQRSSDGAVLVVDFRRRMLARNGAVLLAGAKRFRMLATIAVAAGEWIARLRVVEAIWGDDPDGGPVDPSNSIYKWLWRSRQALRRLGLAIETHRYDGYRIVEVAG